MSRNNHRSGRNNRQNKNRSNAEQSVVVIDNPVVACFREYAKELDDKHDRYERIVKIGRDITIESKRVIFLLHTIDQRQNNRDKVLKEAEKRLQAIFQTQFLQIARELGDLDQYQYSRAYSAGLQEFIEAHSFYEYLSENKTLSDWEDLQKNLKYSSSIEISTDTNKTEQAIQNENESIEAGIILESKNADNAEDSKGNQPPDNLEKEHSMETKKNEVMCLVKPVEFMLGLSDVGGEIMRRCINSLGSGDTDTCFQTCRLLQSLYSGYLSLGQTGNREIPRKINTLKQSTLKAENVCYNIKVRGKEMISYESLEPGYDVHKMHHDEVDEGFY